MNDNSLLDIAPLQSNQNNANQLINFQSQQDDIRRQPIEENNQSTLKTPWFARMGCRTRQDQSNELKTGAYDSNQGLQSNQNNASQLINLQSQQDIRRQPIEENNQSTLKTPWYARMCCRTRQDQSNELKTGAYDSNQDKSQLQQADIPNPVATPPPEQADVPQTPSIKEKLGGCFTSIKTTINGSLMSLGPYLIGFFYYSTFLANLSVVLYLLVYYNHPQLAYSVAGCMGLNYLVRIAFWAFLEEEWVDQLPYLDSEQENKRRLVFIYIAIILNVDNSYWSHLIYGVGRRDGQIEYIQSMTKAIQILIEHIPMMYIMTFQFIGGNELNLYLLVPLVLNGLSAVISQYQMNFFNGDSAFDIILWFFLRICELWSKVSICCFTMNLLNNPADQTQLYTLGGVLGAVAIMWFIFFNDFQNDSITGSIFTFLVTTSKVVAIYSFRDVNYGLDDMDSDAQPSLFLLRVNRKLYKTSYQSSIISLTKLTFTVNACVVFQLCYICYLWQGLQIILQYQFLTIVMGSGIGCFAIVLLYYMYFSSTLVQYYLSFNLND